MAVDAGSFMATAAEGRAPRAIRFLIGERLLRPRPRRAQGHARPADLVRGGELRNADRRIAALPRILRHTSKPSPAAHHVEQQYVGLETFGEAQRLLAVGATRTA